MIFTHKKTYLKYGMPHMYEEILHLIKEKHKSLEYVSPFILKQLLDSTVD